MASVCVCDDYFEVLDSGELCLKAGTMGLREQFVFSTPGTFTFTKADYPWLARVRVTVQGAGGGGAGADAGASQSIARPGGTGGSWAMSILDVSALGATETIVVGAGGDGGVGNNAGDPGGSSSFGGLVVAPGGFGGIATMSSGTALTAASGVSGPAGATGQVTSGGGGSGGAIRLDGGEALSGAGGDSQSGQGGAPRASEGPGTMARGCGAGGGGAVSYGNPFDGAVGGSGQVVIELYG